MPANLTPQYHKAEESYRKAQSPEEQIDCLQEMLKLIPKHKGTEKLQADLKSRLKDANSQRLAEKQAPKKGLSYRIPRQGAGQVILLGAPNSGKSRLLAELSNAQPEVASYPFTTREPMPGMMPWEDVKVQLIDTPPITDSHIEPYLTGMVRSADLALLCFDGSSDDAPEETATLIGQLESRKTLLSDKTGFDEDDFSIVQVKTLLVITRGDDPDCATRLELFYDLVPNRFEIVTVELDSEESREKLKNSIYESLGMIRVYTKSPGKPADYKDPYSIPEGGTVEDVAIQVHRELAEKLKFAKVWGKSVHDGQSVGREHVLGDKDLVELHT
ncbi:MAG: TGS domain-containing protein [Planctomycetes bacterium]|nr:TGS domain-containing protein [Planctomycetota bacterium]